MVRLCPFRLMFFGDLDNWSGQWPAFLIDAFCGTILFELCFLLFYGSSVVSDNSNSHGLCTDTLPQ